jgi:hypothetical protein
MHWIRAWLCPRANTDMLEERKNLFSATGKKSTFFQSMLNATYVLNFMTEVKTDVNSTDFTELET